MEIFSQFNFKHKCCQNSGSAQTVPSQCLTLCSLLWDLTENLNQVQLWDEQACLGVHSSHFHYIFSLFAIFSHFLFAVSLFRFSYQILDGASEIIPILLTQAKFWNCVKLSYQFLWRHYIFITLKNFWDVEHIQYKAPNKDFMLVLSQENM